MAHYMYQSGIFPEMADEFVANSEGFIRINTACPRSTLDRAIDVLVNCFHDGSEAVAEMRTRRRLSVGETMPDFTYATPYDGEKDLYEALGDKPMMLLFLRYYGCPVCQLDLRMLTKEKNCSFRSPFWSRPTIRSPMFTMGPTPEGAHLSDLHKSWDVKHIQHTLDKLLTLCTMEEIDTFFRVIEKYCSGQFECGEH